MSQGQQASCTRAAKVQATENLYKHPQESKAVVKPKYEPDRMVKHAEKLADE